MVKRRCISNSASAAWKKHREELVPWAVGLLLYLAFMRQAEPSRFTNGMLVFLSLWPLVFIFRMIYSIRKMVKY